MVDVAINDSLWNSLGFSLHGIGRPEMFRIFFTFSRQELEILRIIRIS